MAHKMCGECQLAINDVEQSLMCGLCETTCHISLNCCGFTSQHIKKAIMQGKTVFVCISGRRKLDGRSICSYLKETNCIEFTSTEVRAVPEQGPANLNDLIAQVQQLASVLEELNGEVDDLTKRKQFVTKSKPSSYRNS